LQHSDPNHPSQLPELLSRNTKMSVRCIEENLPLEPNHIYVSPPEQVYRIRDGRFHAVAAVKGQSWRAGVDVFLWSLAEEFAEKAICVILSGMATDGYSGMKAIKTQGGLLIAQKSSDAAFEAMPDAAVHTGLVDRVLTISELPDALMQYVRAIPGPLSGEAEAPRADDPILTQVIGILLQRTGHDFNCYKPRTLMRRITRRARINNTRAPGPRHDDRRHRILPRSRGV
jgi:two-component system CheB/CheR fusion protein